MSEDVAEIARQLRRRGLAVPAAIALEALRPLRPLVDAGATFTGGWLPIPSVLRDATATDAGWDAVATALDDDPSDECPTSEG
jgi:hypothetical protein